MDDGCGFGPRDWGCIFEQPPYKSNIGLQLMSTVGVENSANGIMSNGAFFHREPGMMPNPPMPMDFTRESWMQPKHKFMHMLPVNQPNFALPSDNPINIQIVPLPQLADQPKDDIQAVQVGDNGDRKDPSSKKRSAGRLRKNPDPKKPKKASVSKEEAGNGAVLRGKTVRKNVGMVINGVDLDISSLPTPVCSCTGAMQQCYRWGVGGWQSACCTTSMSLYPLPMSQKRRGARIAGRKMSQGAFKKVLEKLLSEGYELLNPIDLKLYWAKHGTNKFVTIR